MYNTINMGEPIFDYGAILSNVLSGLRLVVYHHVSGHIEGSSGRGGGGLTLDLSKAIPLTTLEKQRLGEEPIQDITGIVERHDAMAKAALTRGKPL